MGRAVNVLALVRDGHRYVFLYDDDSVETILGTLSEYASDPELDFTWYDAAVLAQRVRRLRQEQEQHAALDGFEQSEDFPSFF